MRRFFDTQHLKGDIFGGIAAGIVALPLALAFGVQSGLGAIAGLYGAIMLGIFAAILGGTAVQVSGPTGPMTVISALVVTTTIQATGSLESAMGIIIATFLTAGVFQIVLGLLKVGRYIRYMPYPVVSGFMTGIGFIIILYQLYPLMGLGSVKNTLEIVLHFGGALPGFNKAALGLGVATIAIIYLLPRITKVVPSTLVALVVMTAISASMGLNVSLISDIPTGLPSLKLGLLSGIEPRYFGMILKFGLTLAALGMIDSLLTSVIADNITKTKHDSNRELVGQGIGNMMAATIGGLPGAGATMRTVINVNTGGRTRLSGFIHGLFLVGILLGLGKYAAYVPLSVLAGILITVGVGIIDYKGLRHLRRVPRADAATLLIVLLITVFGNLLHAVGAGLILACVLFMRQVGDLSEKGSSIKAFPGFKDDLPWDNEESIYKAFHGKVYIKHLYGPLFFGFTSHFQELVNKLDHHHIQVLIVRMDKVPYIDQSGVYALEEAIYTLQDNNVVVLLTNVQPQPLDMLKKIDIVPALIPEIHVFSTFSQCHDWLKENLKEGKKGFDKIVNELHEIKKAKVDYQM